MAIQTLIGDEVDVVAHCGKCRPYWAAKDASLVLVRVRFGNGDERHRLAMNLRADGGRKEVDAAVDAAPQVVLTGDALTEALAEAE